MRAQRSNRFNKTHTELAGEETFVFSLPSFFSFVSEKLVENVIARRQTVRIRATLFAYHCIPASACWQQTGIRTDQLRERAASSNQSVYVLASAQSRVLTLFLVLYSLRSNTTLGRKTFCCFFARFCCAAKKSFNEIKSEHSFALACDASVQTLARWKRRRAQKNRLRTKSNGTRHGTPGHGTHRLV